MSGKILRWSNNEKKHNDDDDDNGDGVTTPAPLSIPVIVPSLRE